MPPGFEQRIADVFLDGAIQQLVVSEFSVLKINSMNCENSYEYVSALRSINALPSAAGNPSRHPRGAADSARTCATVLSMATQAAPLDPAALLPGRWRVVATNRPCWLVVARSEPTIDFALGSNGRIAETVGYTDERRGQVTRTASNAIGGETLRRRPAGLRRSGSCRWRLTGSIGELLGVRFEPSFRSPGGVEIWLRDGVEEDDPRAAVSRGLDRLGFTLQEFAALSWIAGPDLS